MIDRNLRRSVLKHVRSLFEAPPAGTLSSAYSVYGPDDLLAVQRKEQPPPARPYLYLLDAYLRPTNGDLPIVQVEVVRTRRRPFELGNQRGRWTDVQLHVWGRSRGERDDLGSFLADNLGAAIPIYTFPTSGSTAVFSEYAIVHDEIDLENVESNDALRQEGSLDLWQIVTFSMQSKQ